MIYFGKKNRAFLHKSMVCATVLFLAFMLPGCSTGASDIVPASERPDVIVIDESFAEKKDTEKEAEDTAAVEDAEPAEEMEDLTPDVVLYEDMDSIIAALPAGSRYTIMDMPHCLKPVLLTTGGVYEREDGVNAAISFSVYGAYEDSYVEYGSYESDGKEFPISYDGEYLYIGGKHYMSKVYVDDQNVSITMAEEVHEVFDEESEDREATYFYFSFGDFIEGEWDAEQGRKVMDRMFEDFEKAGAINFDRSPGEETR